MIAALFIGLIVGVIAKMLMPGKDPGGFFVTALIGIAGAILAHWIGVSAGWYAENQPAGFFASVIGSMVLLAGYRAIAGRRGLTH